MGSRRPVQTNRLRLNRAGREIYRVLFILANAAVSKHVDNYQSLSLLGLNSISALRIIAWTALFKIFQRVESRSMEAFTPNEKMQRPVKSLGFKELSPN